MTLSKQLVLLFIFFSLFGCGRKGSDEGVGVTVVPSFFKLPSGGEAQFSADVSGTLNKEVTWEVSGPLGTSISSGGLFRAPLNAGGQTATVRAVSQDDPNTFGNAAVTMTSFSKVLGETIPAGSDRVVVGGYTIRAGQTIDLNEDNTLDLVSMSPSGNLAAIYLGIGNGLFRKQAEIAVSEPSAMTMGDFVNSEDFVADVAIASRSERTVKIVSGEAGSANSPFVVDANKTKILSLPGVTPSALAAGRFHGDVESRNSDLVVGTDEGAMILFLQDRLTDSFTAQPAVAVSGKITQMVAADLNGDDLLDLAVLHEGAGDVLIFLGDGAGAFSGSISVSFASPPASIAVGDFNGDERNDLAAAHAGSNQVSISLGKGDGTFELPLYKSVESAPASISVGDFNLGGGTDIAVALPASKAVLILFNDGAGNLIGNFRYDTGVAPLSLVPGFFTTFDNPQGFQSVGLIYISATESKFHLLNNVSF